jgi:hypothetical protein
MSPELSNKIRGFYNLEYPVLGIRTIIKSDIIQVYKLAESRFGHWLNLSQIDISPNPPLIVTIYKSSISSFVSESSTIQYNVDKDILSADAAGVVFTADRRSGRAEAYVNPSLADLSDFFQKNILECMVLFLVTSTDREPLHASAVIRNQKALLICGNSGSGKTTLAYSLYKRGAYILSESSTYIASRNGFQLWGDPLGFNFEPGARVLFPELINIPEYRFPDGRIKISLKLPMQGKWDRRKWSFSGNIVIVFPERKGGHQSRISEISHADMLKRLTSNRESGFDLSDTFVNIVSGLPVKGSYIIETGNDLLQTVEILESLF